MPINSPKNWKNGPMKNLLLPPDLLFPPAYTFKYRSSSGYVIKPPVFLSLSLTHTLVEMEEQPNSSYSSSTDSNGHPSPSTAPPFSHNRNRDFSAELRLGLSLSSSASGDSPPYLRDELPDWSPINPVIRNAVAERGGPGNHENQGSFFVKIYMEGIPIGRKLDLFMHDSYQSLIKTLRRMFQTTIIGPDLDEVHSTKAYVLTYEDKEGDWMMVGDVPWEFFLATVKKLKIARIGRC